MHLHRRRKGPLTVTIVNWAGVNVGDDAIFSSLLTLLRNEYGPDARIFVIADNSKKVVDRYDLDRIADIFEFYHPHELIKVLRMLRDTDLVIFGGGDLINGDMTSMSLLGMAQMLGIPVMCCAVGVLPFERSWRSMITKAVLDSMKVITVRDESSARRLKEMGIRSNVHVTADLAFLLEKGSGDRSSVGLVHDEGSYRIGVNVRSQDEMYDFYAKWDDEKIMDVIANACDELIRDNDASVYFIPMEKFEEHAMITIPRCTMT